MCYASKHMKCTFKCIIQVYELAPPTCVLKNLNWSLSFVISRIDPFSLSYFSSYVKFSPCINITTIFLPLFHFYLCTIISPPLSSMTTKVQNVGSTTCRVKIINVNQWGEDHISKIWSNLDHLPKIFNSVWSKDKLLHTSK